MTSSMTSTTLSMTPATISKVTSGADLGGECAGPVGPRPADTSSPGGTGARRIDEDAHAGGEERGLYGPRGWTVEAGVWRELVGCRDEVRSTIIPAEFDEAPQGIIDDGMPQDDYTPFHDLGPRTARRLLEILPPAQLGDRQNLAPTLGTLLRACARADGRVRLSGYGIGPQRPDERVTVEGLWIADPDLLDLEIAEAHDEHCACLDLWRTVRARYELDADSMPDEIRPLRRHRSHGPVGTWLWWD